MPDQWHWARQRLLPWRCSDGVDPCETWPARGANGTLGVHWGFFSRPECANQDSNLSHEPSTSVQVAHICMDLPVSPQSALHWRGLPCCAGVCGREGSAPEHDLLSFGFFNTYYYFVLDCSVPSFNAFRCSLHPDPCFPSLCS